MRLTEKCNTQSYKWLIYQFLSEISVALSKDIEIVAIAVDGCKLVNDPSLTYHPSPGVRHLGNIVPQGLKMFLIQQIHDTLSPNTHTHTQTHTHLHKKLRFLL